MIKQINHNIMKNIFYSSLSRFPFRYVFSTLCICLATGYSLQAQSVYNLSASKDNVVKVVGSSNVHDWNMVAQNPTCEAEFGAITGDNIPKSLSSLSFSVNAKSLKSEHDSMDGRTYKTIKADEYPKITFKLTSATITSTQKSKFLIKASGNLTIAGVTKPIIMQVNGEVKADNTITCTGEEKIKLTDYNIQPPSFMLGAMKVANDLSIKFTLNFKK